VTGFGQPAGLVVGDDLAGLRDVLFDDLDLVGPVASGFVRVGKVGGILALGLGQMVEEDVEVLLGSEAGHRLRVSPWHRLESGTLIQYKMSLKGDIDSNTR